jgi:glutaredoxin
MAGMDNRWSFNYADYEVQQNEHKKKLAKILQEVRGKGSVVHLPSTVFAK